MGIGESPMTDAHQKMKMKYTDSPIIMSVIWSSLGGICQGNVEISKRIFFLG